MRHAPLWSFLPLFIAALTTMGGFWIAARWSGGLGTFVMGIGVLGFGSLPLIWERQNRQHAQRANGIVIAYEKDYPDFDDDKKAWLPIVRFTPPNGEEITFKNGDSRRPKSLPVSAKVTVLYDPENPEIAIITPPKANVGAYLAVLFALTLMGIGILILIGHLH